MARKAQAATETHELKIARLEQGRITLPIVGTTPLLLNSMALRARAVLLRPDLFKRDTAAERAKAVKHDPVREFQESFDRYPWREGDPEPPTLIVLPRGAPKGAMRTAALDLPGATKTRVGRLISLDSLVTPVWGIPRLSMMVVRCADMAHTADIRTRAMLDSWCAVVSVRYIKPMMTPNAVASLLHAGGLVSGVGDGRPDKGALNFGSFRITDETDEEFRYLVDHCGRAAQLAAVEAAESADSETQRLRDFVAEAEVSSLREKDEKAAAAEAKAQQKLLKEAMAAERAMGKGKTASKRGGNGTRARR